MEEFYWPARGSVADPGWICLIASLKIIPTDLPFREPLPPPPLRMSGSAPVYGEWVGGGRGWRWGAN